MMWVLLVGLDAPPPPPVPLWEEVRSVEATYQVHRWLGYGVLTGSLVQLGLGWVALSAYERGTRLSDGVRYTHRILGYAVIGMATAGAFVGSWNLLSMQSEHRRKKHYLHAALSWLATGGYVLAGVLAYQARTLPDYERYRAHRNVALATAGATLLTVGVIVW